ncbi:hypothetical protein V6000_005057 [Aspergillus fumigatus]|jgi:hypothetical protein
MRHQSNRMGRLHLELFLLSNNLASQVSSEISGASMNSNHKSMQMFKTSGWTSPQRLQILLPTPEPTAGAIPEQLPHEVDVNLSYNGEFRAPLRHPKQLWRGNANTSVSWRYCFAVVSS